MILMIGDVSQPEKEIGADAICGALDITTDHYTISHTDGPPMLLYKRNWVVN